MDLGLSLTVDESTDFDPTSNLLAFVYLLMVIKYSIGFVLDNNTAMFTTTRG